MYLFFQDCPDFSTKSLLFWGSLSPEQTGVFGHPNCEPHFMFLSLFYSVFIILANKDAAVEGSWEKNNFDL